MQGFHFVLLATLAAMGCATARPTNPVGPAPSVPAAPPATLEVTRAGDELIVKVGDRTERLRYVEESRTVEEFNYPRVIAMVATADGQPLLNVYCHDSYDDCGTNTDDLTCPVVEEGSIEFTQLHLLHERLGGEVSPVKLVDALGAATPIAACMARFNESEPELVWLSVEGRFEAPDDTVDKLYAQVTAAQELWAADAPGAVKQMEQFQRQLDETAPPPEVVFAAAYGVEQLRANADRAYIAPIVGPGGQVVEGAGELQHVYWQFMYALRAWEQGQTFPQPSGELLREATADSLTEPARRALDEGSVDAVFTAGLGYVAHVVISATDDAWVFVLPDGRVLQRVLFSSRDDADAWPRP